MIELYHKMSCPFSARVRSFISENGLESQVAYHETETEAGAKEKLQQMTGKSQVPCLVIDGKPLLESQAIVSWLEKNVASRENSH